MNLHLHHLASPLVSTASTSRLRAFGLTGQVHNNGSAAALLIWQGRTRGNHALNCQKKLWTKIRFQHHAREDANVRIRIIPKLLGNSPSKRSKTTYNNLTKFWGNVGTPCLSLPRPCLDLLLLRWSAYNHTSTRFSGPAEGGGWGLQSWCPQYNWSVIPSYPIAFLSCNLLKELPRQGQQHPLSARVQGAGENVGECKGICSDYNNQVSIA